MLGSRLCDRSGSLCLGGWNNVPIYRNRRELPRSKTHLQALGDEQVGRYSEVSKQDDRGSKILGLSPAQLLIASASSFGIIALDVFDSNSLHLLSSLDAGMHTWVLDNISPSTSKVVFGRWISDIFILPELILWPIMWIMMARKRFFEGSAAASLSVVGYALGGPVLHGDPILVNALKNAFQRLRPSAGHHTFSFPSGHTTAAVLLTGTILFVFLPILLEPRPVAEKEVTEENEEIKSPLASKMDLLGRFAPLIWGLSYVTTAVGRVGADAHWTSDTLAGLAVGIGLVASMRLCLDELIKAKNSNETS